MSVTPRACGSLILSSSSYSFRCSLNFAGYIQLQPQSIAFDNVPLSQLRRSERRREIRDFDAQLLAEACRGAELALRLPQLTLPLIQPAAAPLIEHKSQNSTAGVLTENHVATTMIEPEVEDELCCTICCELLCEPVSLLCGHTYCSECYDSLLANRIRTCPLCRKTLPCSPPSPNILLRQILKQRHPVEYIRRFAALKPKKTPQHMKKPAARAPRIVHNPPPPVRFALSVEVATLTDTLGFAPACGTSPSNATHTQAAGMLEQLFLLTLRSHGATCCSSAYLRFQSPFLSISLPPCCIDGYRPV